MRLRTRRTAAAALLLAVVACDGSAAPPESSPTAAAQISPTASPAHPTVIGVIGDFGVKGEEPERVVRLMAGFNGGRPLDAVVTTGDNAYVYGTREQAARSREILQPLLGPRTPLYAALGNHDVATADGAHVMRALGIPARWYTRVIGPVELVVLDSNRVTDPAQLAFLRSALGPRKTPFRVVAYHHPASGCQVHHPHRLVHDNWIPLFQLGAVDLVLTGHNHTYERFEDGGLPYVTTGGGGATLYPSLLGACRGAGRFKFALTVYHAVRVTATPETLKVEAIGLDGKTFDSVTVERK